MIAGIIIAAVVAILVIWVIASYNGFIKAKITWKRASPPWTFI